LAAEGTKLNVCAEDRRQTQEKAHEIGPADWKFRRESDARPALWRAGPMALFCLNSVEGISQDLSSYLDTMAIPDSSQLRPLPCFRNGPV